jgi:2-phosphosulfolactate phosphatase
VIVDVAMLPTLARDVERKLCLVVDVLRASTSLAFMSHSGIEAVLIEPNPAAARRAAACLGPNALLAGESGGIKPDDFDLGNSPASFLRPDLAARQVVFCSSNGAKALHLLANAPALMVGAFVNARASAEAAVALASERGLDICIACSGDHGFAHLGIEDVAGAGAIVERMSELAGVHLDESAEMAARVFRSFVSDAGGDERAGATAAIAASRAGKTLASWGLADDIEDCARVDSIDRPIAVLARDGQLVATPLSQQAPALTRAE